MLGLWLGSQIIFEQAGNKQEMEQERGSGKEFGTGNGLESGQKSGRDMEHSQTLKWITLFNSCSSTLPTMYIS